MKLKKYSEFILESDTLFFDSPESLVSSSLKKLQNKLNSLFVDDSVSSDVNVSDVRGKVSDKSDKLSLEELGIRLESSEISKSPLYQTLTIKFSDPVNFYSVLFQISLEEVTKLSKDKDRTLDMVDDVFVKFKKYDIDQFDVIGEISKNVKISDIDEDFLVSLKLEADESTESTEGDLEIETE